VTFSLFTSGEVALAGTYVAITIAALVASLIPWAGSAKRQRHLAVGVSAGLWIVGLFVQGQYGVLDNAFAIVDYVDARNTLARNDVLLAILATFACVAIVAIPATVILAHRKGHSSAVWALYATLFPVVPMLVLIFGRQEHSQRVA